jgi:branched-subunit amino acid transport protein AzlD
MSSHNIPTAILLMAFIILFTRLLPFLFFRRKHPPEILSYLEQNIPPLIMLLLVLYCLKDVQWTSVPYGSPELGAIAIVIMVHLWKSNALLSILSGTVSYMFMIKVWAST